MLRLEFLEQHKSILEEVAHLIFFLSLIKILLVFHFNVTTVTMLKELASNHTLLREFFRGSFKLNFGFEIIVDSHAVFRSKTEVSYMLYPVFPKGNILPN